jgi:hypothetical protein
MEAKDGGGSEIVARPGQLPQKDFHSLRIALRMERNVI